MSEKLRFEYTRYGTDERDVFALRDIDISIKRGSFVAILGHNGSGKSTLARHLNALLTPTSGTLWVKGMDTANPENAWTIRQSTGMVFQNPDNQLVATIVEEDVAFGPENLGVPSAEIRKRVDEALANVRMEKYADSAPHQLSGGQKQRVAIAGILAMRPDCIVLDEPTAMLDPSGRSEVMEVLQRLNANDGITVILITHFMEEAVKAQRVIVMDRGRIDMDGTPKEIFSRISRVKALGLDVPPVTALSHALIAKGYHISEDILTNEEFVSQLQTAENTKNLSFANFQEVTDSASEPQPENTPVIQIKNLTHIYDEGTNFARKALDNVSLSIYKGEFIGLIGHTGSGKSTLIQHLNVLLRPTAGTVLLNGEDIYSDKKKLKEIRRKVGLVFQYPEHQLFEISVYKDVAFGPSNMGLDESEIDVRVKEALRLVGLPDEMYEQSPFELSGGQKRRAAVAGVLAMRPDVLILDEPTAGLDPAGRDMMLKQIYAMHKEAGNTVILVSHSMEEVSRLADRIVVMSEGKVAMCGTPAEVFAEPKRLEAIGLAAPPIAVLMDTLRSEGYAVPQGIFTAEKAEKVFPELGRV